MHSTPGPTRDSDIYVIVTCNIDQGVSLLLLIYIVYYYLYNTLLSLYICSFYVLNDIKLDTVSALSYSKPLTKTSELWSEEGVKIGTRCIFIYLYIWVDNKSH